MHVRRALIAACALSLAGAAQSQVNDVTTPLHLMKPDYPSPYGAPKVEQVKAVLDRVYDYLDRTTPAKVIDRHSRAEITDFSKLDANTILMPGDYRLTSYEWGVTYAGMLQAGAATGDKRYIDYTLKRVQLLADLTRFYGPRVQHDPKAEAPIKSFLDPHALDDAGAICAAIVKAKRAGATAEITAMTDVCGSWVAKRQYRLSDGTLARMRPLPNTLWLDDMFMSVPALAQLGHYDDAVRQVEQFSKRMFNSQLGLYMHGWVEGMSVHPEFHWARANGWAVMALVELLDVLPPSHPGYAKVKQQLQAHIAGLARYQDGTGFWHQLIDRPDTFLETSATAIYAYSIARAVDRGYVDAQAYAPVAILAWNAVASKVAQNGQVFGTCVGTGMGFDTAFYAYRPVNPFAAHSYGPVLLAGAEIITMLKTHRFEINDSAVMLTQAVLETGSMKPMPKEWIDKDTGHRVKRLEGRQGPISNWYFHNNPFFDERMVFSESDGHVRQLYTINVKDNSIVQLTDGDEPKRLLPMTSQKTREAIYQAGSTLYAINVDTKQSRRLYTFQAGQELHVGTINADGTMLAGSFADPKQGEILRQYPKKADYFPRIFDAHLKNSLFTIDLRTGQYKVVHEENTWLGHVQFSPSDPDVLMFCHEGPWDKVERIWNINVKSGKLTLMHERSMPMEIAGHEFFEQDGRTIWFDLQKPRGTRFYLAGADTASGAPVAQYEMTADEWSIHFAISPDKTMFAGDGGDPTQVAKARDGMWIYAFHPEGGRFKSERLVNMKAHDYRALEPNVHFTADGKWIVFGATFDGVHGAYAVEVAPARS